MKELHLEKCPFCSGSVSVIKGYGIFGGVGYNIKCNCCGVVTPTEEVGMKRSIGLEGINEIYISDIEAINKLVLRWNIRQAT